MAITMRVSGWASTPDVDKNNEKVMPGALAQLSLPVKHLPLLYRHAQHEITEAIGKIDKLESRKGKLWTEVTVTNRRVIDAIKRRVVTGFSVRLGVAEKVKQVGYTQINKAAIMELSLVCEPVNPCCVIVKAEEYEDHIAGIQEQVSIQYGGFIQAMKSLQDYIEKIKAPVS